MTPAVLLGGLNIVRALGTARIPVLIASSERETPSRASRYCTGTIELRGFKASKDLSLLAWLWSLAEAPKVYDLFACDDPGPFLRRFAQRARQRLLRLKPWQSPAK
jgi:predicted ATP-grasp superfamily ATP-dependent carboligase